MSVYNVPPFSLGVLALCSLKKSLQTIRWKYSAMKKNTAPRLARVFCLAFVKRIPRHSLYNLKASIATDGQCEKIGR